MTTYFLSDHEGTLCVAMRFADNARPQYIVNHFPTGWTVADFCRSFDMTPDQLRGERVQVRPTMPGEYRVTVLNPGGYVHPSFSLALRDHGKTMSAAVSFEPVPRPRVGKGSRIEWQSGRWRIEPPKGRPRYVEV